MKNAIQTILQENPLQLVVQVVGILVIVLNLYLTSKLYPLAESIRKNEFRITAIESDYERGSSASTGFAHITTRLDRIDEKLDKLEDKIDALR